MERLPKIRAPLDVGFPEMGERGRHLCVIPNRFRRCRALFRPVYEGWQRQLQSFGPGHTVTPDEMASECKDAASEQDLKWRDVGGEMVRRMGSLTWTADSCRPRGAIAMLAGEPTGVVDGTSWRRVVPRLCL
jgi:hypothetical protein